MIHQNIFTPDSIAIVGGSENTAKPGGKIIENLKNSPFPGDIFVVNPKATSVQGLRSYQQISEAPTPDLAILAIPARFCPDAIRELCEKGTRAFIVISAGFGELDAEGKALDLEILNTLDRYTASLLGPNCIGLIHENHHSVFTTPVPDIRPDGVEFISSSGSTAVFVIEAGMQIGFPFSNIYPVGNALQIRVEDILEYLDETYIPGKSPKVKMIYIENIDDPKKFILHARNLRKKGARIVALKAGMTEAGSRAASSHTGAMASPAVAVDAMFRKAGVIACSSRQELLYIAGILLTGLPKGPNVAVITHAGGAGVLLTDALERGGVKVPEIHGPEADALVKELYAGSSVKNPIDFLATGTREQLEKIIDACEQDFDQIDSMAVIFGSPGLFDVQDVYELLQTRSKTLKKPLYPILPSPVNNAEALENYRKSGGFYFEEESLFGQCLAKVLTSDPIMDAEKTIPKCDETRIRQIIREAGPGYLAPGQVSALLQAAGLPMIREAYATNQDGLIQKLKEFDFPIVLKVIGPVHKSDIGGVVTGIPDADRALDAFDRIMSLPGAEGALIQSMARGMELFAGAKKEGAFGHLVLFGMGGIYLEVFRDVQALLSPILPEEADLALTRLKSHPMLLGARGQKGIHRERFIDLIIRLGYLLELAPEILEMDLNPILAEEDRFWIVDARIRVQ